MPRGRRAAPARRRRRGVGCGASGRARPTRRRRRKPRNSVYSFVRRLTGAAGRSGCLPPAPYRPDISCSSFRCYSRCCCCVFAQNQVTNKKKKHKYHCLATSPRSCLCPRPASPSLPPRLAPLPTRPSTAAGRFPRHPPRRPPRAASPPPPPRAHRAAQTSTRRRPAAGRPTAAPPGIPSPPAPCESRPTACPPPRSGCPGHRDNDSDGGERMDTAGLRRVQGVGNAWVGERDGEERGERREMAVPGRTCPRRRTRFVPR